MQFHREVDETQVRRWLELDAAKLCRNNPPGVQRAGDVLPAKAWDIARSQAIASCIYMRWALGLMR